jgi:hypothetical protein
MMPLLILGILRQMNDNYIKLILFTQINHDKTKLNMWKQQHKTIIRTTLDKHAFTQNSVLRIVLRLFFFNC